MRDGYWLNLTDLSWTQRRFPPYPPFLEDERFLPDKMVSFRDAPTIFGNTQVGTVTRSIEESLSVYLLRLFCCHHFLVVLNLNVKA